MGVKLRQKKGRNGNFSLYLDIYSKGKRKYEFLKIHIAPKDSNKKEKMEIAERIRLDRELAQIRERFEV